MRISDWSSDVCSSDLLLVTGDGRHIAAAQPDGSYALLRDRAGDYVRDMVAEAAGIDAPLLALADLDHVECNRDFCRGAQGKGAARRVILASHGRDRQIGSASGREREWQDV